MVLRVWSSAGRVGEGLVGEAGFKGPESSINAKANTFHKRGSVFQGLFSFLVCSC